MVLSMARTMKAAWLLLLFLFFSAPRTVFHDCAGHDAGEHQGEASLSASCSICGTPTPAMQVSLELALVVDRFAHKVWFVVPIATVQLGARTGEYGRGPPALA